jgi:hypothetical protein
VEPSSTATPNEEAERIGPFHVIEELGASAQGRWLLAFDSRLLRRVWMHEARPGTPPVSEMQRRLNRRSRLRWITGRRAGPENWDAYEAPLGIPLPSLQRHPQPWDSVRFWLHDLAQELTLAEADGSVPEVLALDRVWITPDGHAKLLDFPAPGLAEGGEAFPDPAAFLRGVAAAALESAREPISISGQSLLEAGPSLSLVEWRDRLQRAVRQPARVTRARRVGVSLAIATLPTVLIAFWIFFTVMGQSMLKRHPDVSELSTMTLSIRFEPEGERREQLRRYVAHHHRDLIEDPGTWARWETTALIEAGQRRIAEEAVADYPHLGGEEIEVSKLAARSILEMPKEHTLFHDPEFALAMLSTYWIMFAAIPALGMALLLRRGLILWMFGLVVVNEGGSLASRGRAFWRVLLAWSPLLLGTVLVALATPRFGVIPSVALGATLYLVLLVLSHLRRDRSLQDRLAGTWLVPK